MQHIRETIAALMARASGSVQTYRIGKQLGELKHSKVLVQKHVFNTHYMLKMHQRAEWAGVDPVIKEFTRKLFYALRKQGFPMYVHTALRSHELQIKLYQAGHSKVSNGPHQRGAAVDVVHAFEHWDLPKDVWWHIGRTGKKIIKNNRYPIEWGGDFKSLYDPAHWQLKDWRKKVPVVFTPQISVKRSPYSREGGQTKQHPLELYPEIGDLL